MKVSLIGAGLQGKRRARSIRQSRDAELVIVADINAHAARRLADEMQCQVTTDWREVININDVDVVVVSTPPDVHSVMSVAALKMGKHVLCEKPLARNPKEAKQIVEAVRETGKKLKCGLPLRHHPAMKQAKKWLDDGIIGEIMFLRARYGNTQRPGFDQDWRVNPDVSGGGQLMDQGMHILDLSRYFIGEFIEAVCFTQTAFWDIAPVEDNAFALLRTATGQVASMHVSWTQWKNLFSFEIFGQNGYILIDGHGGSYGTEKITLGRREFYEPFKQERTEFRGADLSWHEEWEEFTADIEEDRVPSGNELDGLAAVELAFALYESAHKGSVVKLI